MTSTSARAAQIAAFYAHHADRLHRVVAAKVNAPAQTIEDACQNAWATLLRREDITLDGRGAAWLATVAIREGWRLAGTADVPIGAIVPGVPEVPEPAAAEQALARIEHAERVANRRTLKPRERREPVPPGPRLPLQRDRRLIWSHPVSSPPVTRCRALTTCR